MSSELFEYIRAGDRGKVESLLEANPALLEAVDENGLGAYTVARYSRQEEIAKLLLERGAKLDIHAASMAGLGNRVSDLLAHNRESLQTFSHDGWTPLHLAAFFGNKVVAEVLLANGADVNARSRNAMENTALHAAVAGKHRDVVPVLLAHGADVNARQHGGWTPLHSAAQNGDAELVSLLLAIGADPKARADNNQTALDLALTKGHQDVVTSLSGSESALGA